MGWRNAYSRYQQGPHQIASARRIEPEATKLFGQMRTENFLKDLPPALFVARLAHYFCELNVIHPFREGNGRAQRLLFELIALNAGYAIRWTPIPAGSWIPANIAAYNGHLEPLIMLLEDAVIRLE